VWEKLNTFEMNTPLIKLLILTSKLPLTWVMVQGQLSLEGPEILVITEE
jgi:hypothetical protein